MRLNSGHPRRRKSDLVDAGWRLCLAVSLLGVWLFIVSIMVTSPTRGPEWVWYSMILGIPVILTFIFAILTINAVLVDRSWLRAERMAKSAEPARGVGTTSE
jgi:hypothetical protein